MTEWSQDFTVKSNARRAARKMGVDPDSVVACKGNSAFHFALPASKAIEPQRWWKGKSGYSKARDAAKAQAERSGLSAAAFALIVSYVEGQPEYAFVPAHGTGKYALATGNEKPTADKMELAKAARLAKVEAKAKGKGKTQAGGERAKPGEGQDKLDQVLRLITRKGGATMPEIEKATGWLPHTARARISGLAKKHKLAIERTRLLGVTTYQANYKTKKAA